MRRFAPSDRAGSLWRRTVRSQKALGLITLAMLAPAFGTSSVEAKFHALQTGAYPLGARVPFTSQELNAYISAEIPVVIGPGVRNARVETDNGNIVRGFADIDFVKLRQSQGEKPNWLMSQLLAGQRPVKIVVRVNSSYGRARVDVVQVSVSGIVAEGRTLDFLINHFVVPTFPDIKVGREFALDYNIDRLDVRPGRVSVVLRSR